ncbi:MAG: response regulator [Nitrosopumilus sp.]|nr:response regulator [Nitrososphaerota archaeon]MCH9040858.1 response regulator [Nitrososphaerota archaeon]
MESISSTLKEILIIEDNQSIISLLSRFFDLKKIPHTEATNGQNGLNLIRQKKFSVILLDINMPEFTGYDVIDALEKEGKLKDENIFIFTATSISESEESDLKKRGILGCIRKPIQINQLLTMIGA